MNKEGSAYGRLMKVLLLVMKLEGKKSRTLRRSFRRRAKLVEHEVRKTVIP